MTAAPTSSTHRSMRFYLRVLLPIVAGALLLFAVFVWWLSHRAGADYIGTPETLLPANTAAIASWHNFNSFLQRFQQLHAVQQMQMDESLAALLLTDPNWREIQKEKDKTRYKVLSQMAGNFVEKWLGHEVTLAVVPPETSEASKKPEPGASALLVIARTNIGFEYNLAALVAELYPDLALQKREYRGHLLVRFNAKRSRSGFSYCRFGNTVILSLRSPEWRRLERIVDMKIGAARSSGESLYSLASLAADPAFLEARKRKNPTADGLNICIMPKYLEPAMRSFPGKFSGTRGFNFWLKYTQDKLQGIRWGTLNLYLDKGIHAESYWKYTQKKQPLKPSPEMAVILKKTPLEAPLMFYAQSSQLARVSLELRDRMANSKTYEKKVRKFEKDWKKNTGSRFREDWLKPMGASCGAALTAFQNGLLFPVPVVAAWWECVSAESSQKLENSLHNRKAKADALDFALGQFQFLSNGNQLKVSLNEQPASSTLKEQGGLLFHPLFRDLSNPGQRLPVFCLFANFRTGYDHLYRAYKSAALWSKDVRKDVEKWTTVFAVLQYMDAVRLTAFPEANGVRIDLLIPVR